MTARWRAARMGGGGVQDGLGGSRGDAQRTLARMREEMADAHGEAEAKRRVVEYRMFYADYKAVDGVKLPTKDSANDGRPRRPKR